jgi:hypothetical protein
MKYPMSLVVKVVDGEPMIDTTAMSLLFGIPETAIAAHFNGNTLTLPAEWVRAGKRRAKEASARTGSDGLLPTLAYWAAEGYGATLEIVYEATPQSLAEPLLAAVAAACDAATRPGDLKRLRAIFADAADAAEDELLGVAAPQSFVEALRRAADAAADAADAERPNCAGHLEQIHGIFAAAAGQLADEDDQ